MKLGIVTNGKETSQNTKVDVLALRPLLDVVVVSETVGVKKPDALIFKTAVEALGVAAAETIFVGDHPRNDALGAAAFGMQAVWLRGSHEWPADEERVHSIEKLSQSASYLGGNYDDGYAKHVVARPDRRGVGRAFFRVGCGYGFGL